MWIVKLALNRPYTFIVLALLIFVLSPLVILRTATDIFPNIDIPVISVAWTYTGLNPEDLETRLTTPYEKVLTTLVDNIEHIESTTYNGSAVIKILLQPHTSVDGANAQVVGASQFALRLLPPSVQPPEIINFSASSVPILQLGLSGKGLAEQQLNDLALCTSPEKTDTEFQCFLVFDYGIRGTLSCCSALCSVTRSPMSITRLYSVS
jgi:multidrug efflux pump subunit AcrB